MVFTLTFGPAAEQELSACAEALFHSELGEHHFSEPGLAERSIRSAFRHHQLFTAKTQDNTCVGFIWLIPHGAFFVYPYLHVVAVHPNYRNQGIGTQLLRYAEQIAHSSRLFLEVDEFNPRAHALYESLGYRTVGAIPELFEPGITGFLMMKEITSHSGI